MGHRVQFWLTGVNREKMMGHSMGHKCPKNGPYMGHVFFVFYVIIAVYIINLTSRKEKYGRNFDFRCDRHPNTWSYLWPKNGPFMAHLMAHKITGEKQGSRGYGPFYDRFGTFCKYLFSSNFWQFML